MELKIPENKDLKASSNLDDLLKDIGGERVMSAKAVALSGSMLDAASPLPFQTAESSIKPPLEYLVPLADEEKKSLGEAHGVVIEDKPKEDFQTIPTAVASPFTETVLSTSNKFVTTKLENSSSDFKTRGDLLTSKESLSFKPSLEKPEDITKIEEAVSTVISGEKESVELDIDQNAFSEYEKMLRSQAEVLTSSFGKEKEVKNIEKEITSIEKARTHHLESEEAFAFTEEKLKDPSLSQEDKERLEKQKAKLEKIKNKFGKIRTDQETGIKDESLKGKVQQGFENIAGSWKNLSWKKKLGVGVGLGVLGSAAPVIGAGVTAVTLVAGLSLRSLSAYNIYNGVKARDIAKKIEELATLDEASLDYKQKLTEKILAMDTWSKKGLAIAGFLSVVLPETLKLSGATDLAIGGIKKAAEAVGLIDHAQVAEAASGAVSTATQEVAHKAAEGAISGELLPELHADIAVTKGDNMYEILSRELRLNEMVKHPGAQYNLIENILSSVRANPAEYGIVSGNVNDLQPGDHINIAKLHEILASKTIAGQHLVEHANTMHTAVADRFSEHAPAAAKIGIAKAAETPAKNIETTAHTTTTAPEHTGVTPSPESPQIVEETVPVEGAPHTATTFRPLEGVVTQEVAPQLSQELSNTLNRQFSEYATIPFGDPTITPALYQLNVSDVLAMGPNSTTGNPTIDNVLLHPNSVMNRGGLRNLVLFLSSGHGAVTPNPGEKLIPYIIRANQTILAQNVRR